MNDNTVYDVIVIGCGIAGMTAAQNLMKSGANVLVIEARDRIGGRVNPIDFEGDRQ
jgi:monoamine oxidase